LVEDGVIKDSEKHLKGKKKAGDKPDSLIVRFRTKIDLFLRIKQPQNQDFEK